MEFISSTSNYSKGFVHEVIPVSIKFLDPKGRFSNSSELKVAVRNFINDVNATVTRANVYEAAFRFGVGNEIDFTQLESYDHLINLLTQGKFGNRNSVPTTPAATEVEISNNSVAEDEIDEHLHSFEETLNGPDAAAKLGSVFYKGVEETGSVGQNHLAGICLVHAADNGNGDAAFQIATMSENSQRAPNQFVPTFASANPQATALKYYQLAADLGHEGAKSKVLELTSQQQPQVQAPANNSGDKKQSEKESASKAKEGEIAQAKQFSRLSAISEEGIREADKKRAAYQAAAEKMADQSAHDARLVVDHHEAKRFFDAAKSAAAA